MFQHIALILAMRIKEPYRFFEFCKIREFNAFQPNKYILRDYLFELNEKEVSKATIAKKNF